MLLFIEISDILTCDFPLKSMGIRHFYAFFFLGPDADNAADGVRNSLQQAANFLALREK